MAKSPDRGALKERVALAKEQAREQMDAMPQYFEFWRGRKGAFEDVLAWLDASGPGEAGDDVD